MGKSFQESPSNSSGKGKKLNPVTSDGHLTAVQHLRSKGIEMFDKKKLSKRSRLVFQHNPHIKQWIVP